MRHRIKGRKLGRTASHRQATLKALATQLLKYKKITTTSAKAKETKKFVEPLITKAKKNDLAAKRFVGRYIRDKEVFKELFTEIIEKIGDRQGGYTRVIKLGNRPGDSAELSIIELVDYNELAAPKKKSKSTDGETKAKKSKKAPKKEEAVEAEVVEENETADEEKVEEKAEEKVEKEEDKKETKAKAEDKKKEENKETKAKADDKKEEKEAEKKETKSAEEKKEEKDEKKATAKSKKKSEDKIEDDK